MSRFRTWPDELDFAGFATQRCGGFLTDMKNGKRFFSGCYQNLRCGVGALAIFLLLVLPGVSHATSYSVSGTFRYQIGFSNIPVGGYSYTGGLEGTSGADDGEATYLRVAAGSSASSIGLRAWSSLEYDKQNTLGISETYTASSSASAIGIWDDFLIEGPGTGTVSVSINLYLDGFIFLTGSETPSAPFPAVSSGDVSVGIFVSGSNVGSGQYSQSMRNSVITTESHGILSGFDGDGVIQSLTFDAPVNTPFTLELSLGVNSGVGVAANQFAILASSTDFGNTLTFATDGPVFNLPGGYTLNSAGANISNNSVVPEPSTALLSLTGILLLHCCRRSSRLAGA